MTIEDVVDNGKINWSPDDVEREVFLARQMEYVKGALDGLKGVAEKKSLSGLTQEDKIFEIRALLESIPSIVMTVVMSQGQTPEVNINIFTNLVNIFDNIIAEMVDKLERSTEPTAYQATVEAVLEDVREVGKELKELDS
jgi:hypothetical protein